jgi:hypothetical protein
MRYPKSINYIKSCVFKTEVKTSQAVIEVALVGGKSPWRSDLFKLADIRIGVEEAQTLIDNLEDAIRLIDNEYPREQ